MASAAKTTLFGICRMVSDFSSVSNTAVNNARRMYCSPAMATAHRSLVFRQMFEYLSSTYTYILACATTKQAVIIDPVIETVDRDAEVIRQLGLNLTYGLNTHVHADHVTGTGELRKRFPNMKSVLSKHSGGKADVYVDHGDSIKFGNKALEVRSTPGHTDGCITYVLHENRIAFTGDSLLIRGCGRTDFQQGCPKKLYKSIHEQIFSLPDDFVLYPGHDYKGFMQTSVAEEKVFNPRLTKSLEDFAVIMKELNLPHPKQIEKAVPANRVCGVYELMDEKTRQLVEASTKPDHSQKH